MTHRHLSSLFGCSCWPRRQRDNLSSRAFYPDGDSGVEDFSDDEYDHRQHHRSHRLRYNPQSFSFFKGHHHPQSRRQRCHSGSSSSSTSTRSGPSLEIGALSSRPYRDDSDDEEGNLGGRQEGEGDVEEERTGAKCPAHNTNGSAGSRSPRHASRKPTPFQSLQEGSDSQDSRSRRRGRRRAEECGHARAGQAENDGDMVESCSGDDEEDEDDGEQDRLLGRTKRKIRAASYGGGVGGSRSSSGRNVIRVNTGTSTTTHDDKDNSTGSRPVTPPARPYRLFSFGSISKGSDRRPPQRQQATVDQRKRAGWLQGDPYNDQGEADAEEILDVDALIAEQERITRELTAQEEALRRQEEETIQEKRQAAIKVAEQRGLLRLESDQQWMPTASSSSNSGTSKSLAPFTTVQENCDRHLLEASTASVASSYVGGEDALNQELKMMDLAIKGRNQQLESQTTANGKHAHTSGQDRPISVHSTTTPLVVSTQAATILPHTQTMHLALQTNGCSHSDLNEAEPSLLVSSSSPRPSPSSSSVTPTSPVFRSEPKRTATVSSVSTSTTTSSSRHPPIDPREMLSHLTTSILKRVDGVIIGGGGSGHSQNEGSDDDGGSLSEQETALSQKTSRKERKQRKQSFSQTDVDDTNAGPAINSLERGTTNTTSNGHAGSAMGIGPEKENEEDEEGQETDKISALPPLSTLPHRPRAVSMDIPVRHPARSPQQIRERSSSNQMYEGGSWSSLLYAGASSLMGYFGGGTAAQAPLIQQHDDQDSEDDAEERESEEEEEDAEERSVSTVGHRAAPSPTAEGTGRQGREKQGGGGGGIGASLYASFMSRAKGLAPSSNVTQASKEDEEEEYGEELDYNF